MFDRYTEDAKRTIFFSRCEAHRRGSKEIIPCDILLGACHDEKTRLQATTRLKEAEADLRKMIYSRFLEGKPAEQHTDLPLNDGSKIVLAYAAEEAVGLREDWIDSSHLILGILNLKNDFAKELLVGLGITKDQLRNLLKTNPA